jgi:WG containing repeat
LYHNRRRIHWSALVSSEHGYIDPIGRRIVPLVFTMASAFSGGVALVRRRGRKWRATSLVIDRAGRVVLELPYPRIEPFSENLAAAGSGVAYGFLDREERWAIEPQFDQVASFRGGLAEVQHGDWYGLINPLGEFVWGPTTEGVLCVELESEWVDERDWGLMHEEFIGSSMQTRQPPIE